MIIGASMSEPHTSVFECIFSYTLISLPVSLASVASCKESLKDDPYERQPGKIAGACAPIVQGMALVLVATLEYFDHW